MNYARHLAAILSADVVGYSRLMGNDEERTLSRLKDTLQWVTGPAIARNHGRLVKTYGDGLLAEFGSIVDATSCAIQIQRDIECFEATEPADSRFSFRIGVNLGDVIRDGEDIFGDGVNIAARLEAVAAPSEICITGAVREAVRGKLKVTFDDRGEQQFKNISEPVHVYAIVWNAADWEAPSVSALTPPSLPPSPPPPQPWPAQPRPRFALLLAAIGIAALAAGSFGAWILSQRGAPVVVTPLATPAAVVKHATGYAHPAAVVPVRPPAPPAAAPQAIGAGVPPAPVAKEALDPGAGAATTSTVSSVAAPSSPQPASGAAKLVPPANMRPVIPADVDSAVSVEAPSPAAAATP